MIGDKQIRLVPDGGGYCWRGATPEDDAVVVEIMASGRVTSCPAGWETRPRGGTLGYFCEAATTHYNVEVVCGYE